MKILLLHQYFLEDNDHGGSRFNEMVKVWINEGHQVTVLAGMVHYNGGKKRKEYRGKYTSFRKQGGAFVWRSHVSELYNAHFPGRMWGYFSFVFSSMYTGLCKVKGKHDVIIVTSPPLFVGITGYLLSRIKRIPFIFEVRDLWPESAIDTGVLTNKIVIKTAYAFERFMYRKATRINVLTPAFRKKLIEEKSIPSPKIIYIPNAADFTLSDKLSDVFDAGTFRKEKGWDGKFIITYVGAHGVANHLEQLIEAAGLLEDTNAHFLLIGEGMEKERLIRLAREKKCANVSFIDPVPKADVFKYILASDMGTSVLKKADTFKTIYSNKTFDYMACRKPVLMAIDGVSRDLLEEAEAGVFAEPEDPADYARKVRMYLNNSPLLEKQGENGYVYAKKYFDRNVLAGKYLEEMVEIIKRKSMYERIFKRLLDVTLSLTGFIILLPLFLFITLFLAVTHGPPFFLQQRPGKNNKIFKVIKFRTMNDKRDSNGNLVRDADRLTPFGRFLRKSSLDEIPQLLNVITGNMSLIGPRPLLTEYLPLYDSRQIRRHDVRPGITGWAQVNGRNAIGWQQRFELDAWYVDHISASLDIRIIGLTLLKVLKREGISSGSSVTMEKFEGNKAG